MIHTPKSTFSGPWLLSKEDLISLHDLLEELLKYLTTRQKRKFSREKRKAFLDLQNSERYKTWPPEKRTEEEKWLIDSVKRRHKTPTKKAVVITFKDDHKITVKTIKEAIELPELRDRCIKSLKVTIEKFWVTIELEVPRHSMDGDLKFYVHPDAQTEGNYVLSALCNWAEQRKPSWQRWLLSTPIVLRWGVWLGTIWLLAILAAQKIISNETTLWVIIISFVTVILLSYPVWTTIGIGKNESLLKNRIWYVDKVTSWVPKVIIGGLIIKLIHTFAGDWIRKTFGF